jgi:hypothetical protein
VTLATDLQSAHGTVRRFYLQIAGMKERLWQAVQHPDRNGLLVLEGAPGPPSLQDPSLLVQWRCSEYADAADFADATGNGHTGTAVGSPPAVTSAKFGQSRNFNGVGKYATFTHAPRLKQQSMTWLAWVKPTGSPADLPTIAHQDNTGLTPGVASWRFGGVDATFKVGLYLEFDDDSTLTVTPSAALSADTDAMVSASYDAVTGVGNVYHDGVLVGTGTASGSKVIQYNTDTGAIGTDTDDTAKRWLGQISYLSIYGETKSAEWHRRQYIGGRDFTRPGLNCLELPSVEHHSEFDLESMASQLSGMAFTLSDIEDPTDRTKSYFGKLFAPGRWDRDDENHTMLRRKTPTDVELEASATIINVKKTDRYDNFATSGEAHLGAETFSYTGKGTASQSGWPTGHTNETLGTFTGCIKGLYPAFTTPRGGSSTTFGHVYEHAHLDDDLEGSTTGSAIVSTVPYTWIGREVGLYVTAWDTATADWHSEGDASLVWAGTIESIGYDPQDAGWRLECQSLLEILRSKKIGGYGPSADIRLINLNGDLGREFTVLEYDADGAASGDLQAYCKVTIAKGYYRPEDVASLISSGLAVGNWTVLVGASISSGTFEFRDKNPSTGSGHYQFQFSFTGAQHRYQIIPFGATKTGAVTWGTNQTDPCHALQALGFDVSGVNWIFTTDDNGTAQLQAAQPAYKHYQPAANEFNGSVMFVTERKGHPLWTDQGDLSTAQATAIAKKGMPEGQRGEEGLVAVSYTAKSSKTISTGQDTIVGTELTLATSSRQRRHIPQNGLWRDHFGFIAGIDEAPVVQNVLVPEYRDTANVIIGPFRHLANILCSTGTKLYNEPASDGYDVYPTGHGLAVPYNLLDVSSFAAADKHVLAAYPELSQRFFHALTKEETAEEVIRRELALFGYALTWRLGKLVVQPIFQVEPQDAQITLNDSSTSDPADAPQVLTSPDTVINQRKFEFGYDWSEEKFRQEFVLNDAESMAGMRGITKTRTVKHKGVFLFSEGLLRDQLITLIHAEARLLRFPWQKVNWTLSPTFFNRVFVGDTVGFEPGTKFPDPFGSGSMSATAKALVLDVSWDLEAMRGTCTLLVNSRADVEPWAPCALVDITENSGSFTSGWDSGNFYLKLAANAFGASGDTDDGAALAPSGGEAVRIYARAPADPTSLVAANGEGPYTATVDGAYEADGAGVLTLTADPFGGNFDADVELVVVPGDYGSVIAGQKTTATFQADSNTHLLNSADRTQIWG